MVHTASSNRYEKLDDISLNSLKGRTKAIEP